MTTLFVSAFLLGLVFNAAPGAILSESIRRGLHGGFSPALAVQVGSLVGDALWVVLGLMGAATLVLIPHVQIPLSVAGIALLLYLAYESFRDAVSQMPDLAPVPVMRVDRQALSAGVALSISNPLNIAYWAALGGVIATISGDRPEWHHFAVFIAGFMLSSILWCFFAAGMIAITGQHLSAMMWRGLHLVCGASLVVIAGDTLRRLLISS